MQQQVRGVCECLHVTAEVLFLSPLKSAHMITQVLNTSKKRQITSSFPVVLRLVEVRKKKQTTKMGSLCALFQVKHLLSVSHISHSPTTHFPHVYFDPLLPPAVSYTTLHETG